MAVAGGGVGGAYFALGRDGGRDDGPKTGATHATTAAIDPAQAIVNDVATALARLPKDPASVLAADAKKLVPDPRKALPEGATVVAQEDSWSPDGTGTGGTMAVDVTYPGKPTTTYLAVMVKEESGWKVLATMQASP